MSGGARHGEQGKKTRQKEEEVEGQHQEMDRPAVRRVSKKMEEIGCVIELRTEHRDRLQCYRTANRTQRSTAVLSNCEQNTEIDCSVIEL